VRILALGSTLPDAIVDNYDWASALSFHDYDAIVVDPAEAVSKLIQEVTKGGGGYRSYNGESVEDGPTSAEHVGLADLLHRRREETERLLARDGLVVCFAYPDVPHTRVSGFNGAHRYYWLPAPTGTDYGPNHVKPAGGTHVMATDYEHPFAAYLEQYRSGVEYRALFAEGASGFGDHGRVIGRSPGGAAIALDLRVGGGRVIFLPAMPASIFDRSGFASSLVAAIRNTLLLGAEDDPPGWLRDFALPGLADAEQRLKAAETALEAAEAEHAAARNAFRGIDRYRRLLWQEGKYGLDLPVRDVLSLLGLTTYTPVDEPATFMYGGETIFVETEGSTTAVGMEPHYRLRQRLEAKIASDGRRARGLIVVNGYRAMPPSERSQQYEDALRVASESMRYCVVEATRLYDAVRAHLDGDKERVADFCRRLVETEGAFESAPSNEA
jgi:hypothetical protein